MDVFHGAKQIKILIHEIRLKLILSLLYFNNEAQQTKT